MSTHKYNDSHLSDGPFEIKSVIGGFFEVYHQASGVLVAKFLTRHDAEAFVPLKRAYLQLWNASCWFDQLAKNFEEHDLKTAHLFQKRADEFRAVLLDSGVVTEVQP